MRTILHILTQPADNLARETSDRQAALPEVRVEIVDFTQPDADYPALVRAIFAADAVDVW
jgi:hypothetical protein